MTLLESHGELCADLDRFRSGRARAERLRVLAMVGLAALRGGAPNTDLLSEGERGPGTGGKRTNRRLKF